MSETSANMPARRALKEAQSPVSPNALSTTKSKRLFYSRLLSLTR